MEPPSEINPHGRAKGTFRLDVTAEKDKRYDLLVRKKGYASIIRFRNRFSKVYTLPQPQSLRGRITGPEGQPIAGADVWTPPLAEPVPGFQCAKTDVNGDFEIPDVKAWQDDGMPAFSSVPTPELFAEIKATAKPGTNKQCLRVWHPDYGTKLGLYSQVPATVNVKFEKPAIVTGRVVDQSTRKPLDGIAARLQTEADPVFAYTDAITDGNGGFRLLLQGKGTLPSSGLSVSAWICATTLATMHKSRRSWVLNWTSEQYRSISAK